MLTTAGNRGGGEGAVRGGKGMKVEGISNARWGLLGRGGLSQREERETVKGREMKREGGEGGEGGVGRSIIIIACRSFPPDILTTYVHRSEDEGEDEDKNLNLYLHLYQRVCYY